MKGYILQGEEALLKMLQARNANQLLWDNWEKKEASWAAEDAKIED